MWVFWDVGILERRYSGRAQQAKGCFGILFWGRPSGSCILEKLLLFILGNLKIPALGVGVSNQTLRNGSCFGADLPCPRLILDPVGYSGRKVFWKEGILEGRSSGIYLGSPAFWKLYSGTIAPFYSGCCPKPLLRFSSCVFWKLYSGMIASFYSGCCPKPQSHLIKFVNSVYIPDSHSFWAQ